MYFSCGISWTTDLARSGAIDKAACWFLKTKLIVAAVKHSPWIYWVLLIIDYWYCSGFSKQSLLWPPTSTPQGQSIMSHSLQTRMVFTSYYLQVLWTCRIQSQSALLCVNWLKLPHISYRMTTAHSMTLYSLRKIQKSITMISWRLQSSVKAMINGKLLDTAYIEKKLSFN